MSIKISRGGLTDVEMTRGRSSPLALRVCIGTFLLLFSTVAASIDGLERPPILSLDRDFVSNASEAPTAEKNKAIPNKIPRVAGAEEFVPLDRRDKRDAEPVFSELVNDAKAGDGEKLAVPIDKDLEDQGIRPRNEVDGLPGSDSSGDSSRFEETARETSGKSSSTKTTSDETNRLSRTNDLIVATTKPALEEPKPDEKRNETIRDTSHHEANKTNEAALLEPEREADAQAKLASSSGEWNVSATKLETNKLEDRSTTRKTPLPEKLQERTKKPEDTSPVKNGEVSDLKETDENRGNSEPISLINDTYVNYSHHSKTSTEKNSGTGSGEQSRAVESATNFISEDSAITQKTRDPKEDVEVVGNVTEIEVQRIEDGRSENSTKNTPELDETSESQRSIPNSTRTSEVPEKLLQKLVKLTTEKPILVTAEPQEASSLVPRGRTIAFSGINEFPNQEAKPTPTSRIDAPFTKKDASTEKTVEQKPYPYVKSTGKEEVHNGSNQVDATTEEASALENTIGKGQVDAKFIVTEASDVLENSIQQFKPTYYEKAGNESSTTPTTPLRPSGAILTTTASPVPETTTNQSTDVSIDPKTIAKTEEKPVTTGNDVPRWSEGRDAITDKGSFDMTGNGITEVSVKPEREAFVHEDVVEMTTASLSTVQPQAEVGVPSNPDVQTKAESSLLIRSTLNATELATTYPLIKRNSSDANFTVPTVSGLDATKTLENVTMPPTVIDRIAIGNVTEPSSSLDSNGTNEIPSGVTSPPSTDETLLPSTTAIEYEFVGLTEATTFLSLNVTDDFREATDDVTTVPTVQDLANSGFDNETSTVKTATVTESSVVVETETTNADERSSPVTDEAVAVTTMNPTTQARDDSTAQANLIEEEVASSTKEDDSLRTSSATDSWTTVSDDDTTVTARTDESIAPVFKDSQHTMNVTETPTESTVAASVSTTAATPVPSSSPFVPIGPRTVIPLSSTAIPLSSTAATPVASGIPMETTDDTKMSSASNEITSLVRIFMEGTWNEICPKIDALKTALAKLLSSGTKRSVSNKQIMIHRQPPCPEVSNPTPTPSDMPSILVYVVDENGRFDSAMTTSLPSLYEESKETVKFPFKIHSFLLVQETIQDSGNAIAVVVVSVVAFICLVLLAGLLFIMRKRQTRFNYGERCRPVSLDAYSVDSVSAYNSVRRKGVARSSKRSYGNPTFEDSSAIPSHPLNFAGLSSFCNDVNAINEEFSSIPQISAKIDELPAGAEVKNRYANVIPLPETRVPLQKINNDSLTEYINASYVRGPKNAMRYYIACQAPMESTVTDFWRMIWEQQCKVIIMLTDLVENGVEKCTEYIPPSEITDCHRLYGDFQVTLKKRETKEKYAISTLHLKNLENNTFREVYHIWYLWPVNGAQSDGAGLIAVLLEARALQRGGPGPIVVHCSPGTGRTGTLIALDLGIRQYEITRTVDVPRVVYTIRRDRAGAVQTKEQYAFIYKALNLYATKLAGGVLDST
nr:putative GPI-anchored protein pfl2 [Megalopta genalis]